MTTVFADTSYYLALINAADEHHHAAYEYTQQSADSFVTTV